jgi:putative intracellular protease/amidase/nitroreductase
MTTRILRWLPVALLLVTAVSEVMAQTPVPWYRRGRLEGAYDLRGTTILVVAGRDFNRQEAIEMAECWRRWGAQVEFAGPERMLAAERDEAPGAAASASPATLRVDWLLSEADPSRFDVLYVAGGEGVRRLLADHREELARLIDEVHARGGIVSAICHGPLALAASTSIKGKRLTVQGTTERETLERAGAVVVSEAAVVDGGLVTGQWPHLEEFAVTLAERVKYPGGGGPREKALAARSPVERALDDLRDTHTFDRRPVPPEAVETLMRAAQRAVAARGTRGPRAMRFVAVREAATKTELARQIYDRTKSSFVAMGMPEAVVRAQIGMLLEGAPILLFQFMEAPAGQPPDAGERALRTDTAFAGAAASTMELAARSLGLGVSVIGMQQFLAAEGDVRRALGVPDNQVLVGIYGLGYPAVDGTPAVARPGSDLLFRDRWNGGGSPNGR